MPKKIEVSLTDSAVRDLEGVQAYYREQGVSEIGVRFLSEIIALIEGLAEHPDRGRVVPEFDNPHLRELIHPPFRIVYRRSKGKVSVVRVWRSERLMELP